MDMTVETSKHQRTAEDKQRHEDILAMFLQLDLSPPEAFKHFIDLNNKGDFRTATNVTVRHARGLMSAKDYARKVGTSPEFLLAIESGEELPPPDLLSRIVATYVDPECIANFMRLKNLLRGVVPDHIAPRGPREQDIKNITVGAMNTLAVETVVHLYTAFVITPRAESGVTDIDVATIDLLFNSIDIKKDKEIKAQGFESSLDMVHKAYVARESALPRARAFGEALDNIAAHLSNPDSNPFKF